MGFVVFLLIVGAIIAIVVVRKKKKKEEDIASLKNSEILELALKIRDESIKNGYSRLGEHDSGEPSFLINVDHPYGIIFCKDNTSGASFIIKFSQYYSPIEVDLKGFIYVEALKNRYCGILSENRRIFVRQYSGEAPKDMPEILKIAAEIINNSKYGPCALVDKNFDTNW
jgi:hypothetical protein